MSDKENKWLYTLTICSQSGITNGNHLGHLTAAEGREHSQPSTADFVSRGTINVETGRGRDNVCRCPHNCLTLTTLLSALLLLIVSHSQKHGPHVFHRGRSSILPSQLFGADSLCSCPSISCFLLQIFLFCFKILFYFILILILF